MAVPTVPALPLATEKLTELMTSNVLASLSHLQKGEDHAKLNCKAIMKGPEDAASFVASNPLLLLQPSNTQRRSGA